MKKRNPMAARNLRHKLRWLGQLDAAGDREVAQRVFETLPIRARGVISLLVYVGRFRGICQRRRLH